MPQKKQKERQVQPPQHQDRQPGIESEMEPKPKADDPKYKGSGKLRGRVALITGAPAVPAKPPVHS